MSSKRRATVNTGRANKMKIGSLRFHGKSTAGQVISASDALGNAEWSDLSDLPVGAPGPSPALGYADFYALMPGDNEDTVAADTAFDFPQGVADQGIVVRTTASTFTIQETGTYLVQFQVSVAEAGQIALAVGGVGIASTVVGRATGTNQLYGVSIQDFTALDVVSVINFTSAAALTVTVSAGGTESVSAHLTFVRLR